MLLLARGEAFCGGGRAELGGQPEELQVCKDGGNSGRLCC